MKMLISLVVMLFMLIPSLCWGGYANTRDREANVPIEFSKMTTNSIKQGIVKGQKNGIEIYPRICNEHVEYDSTIQDVVESGVIVGQIFKASHDNITALSLTLESAAGVVLDNFEGYADSTALQVQWADSDDAPLLETTVVSGGTKSMNLPGDTVTGDWTDTIVSVNYTDYTFSLDFNQTQVYTLLKYTFFLGDGDSTLSFPLVMTGTNTWQHFDIDINAMTDSDDTDVTAITSYGFVLTDSHPAAEGYVDDILATAPPGDILVKLWDMGTTLPISGLATIDGGTQYTRIGAALADSFTLSLKGGKRLYHMHQFTAGNTKNLPANETLTVDNYYLIQLEYVNTDVSVYGANASETISYYNSGYAFTTSAENAAITSLGTYADIMFHVFSAQRVCVNNFKWRFDAAPNGNSDISVFIENSSRRVTNMVVDHEEQPEQTFTFDLRARPQCIEDGGYLDTLYNDDFTDSVTNIIEELTFYHEPPLANQ